MIDSCAEPLTSRLRVIDSTSVDDALGLLARGFPEQKRSVWENGFARLEAATRQEGPRGYLLDAGERPVGVLLTCTSERSRPDGTAQPMVNLCGWYVDPDHRLRAPMMLKQVIGRDGIVFTDLTASPSVERINMALGFRVWSEGERIAFLGQWATTSPRSGAEVLTLDKARAELSAQERALLEFHAQSNCIAAVLSTEAGAMPLLFRRIWRKGIPTAQLIYAQSRQAVIAHRAAVARFLISYGFLVLTIDGHRAERVPGSLFRQSFRRYCKGPIDLDRIDYAFSELVLFKSKKSLR